MDRVLGAETNFEFNGNLLPPRLGFDQNTWANLKKAFKTQVLVVDIASSWFQLSSAAAITTFTRFLPAFATFFPGYCFVPGSSFFFLFHNPSLLILFAHGTCTSVSNSVSYVFPQSPVSFVNICLAAGISAVPQGLLADVCSILCCISHLEFRLCSAYVCGNTGAHVHILSR